MVTPAYPPGSVDTAASTLATLGEPGRLLVFCDESQVDGKPTEALVADLRVICAIVMQPGSYAAVSSAFEELLSTFEPRPNEFHTTEIINPPKSSTWRSVPIESRIAALELLCKSLSEIDHFYYSFVSKSQFASLKEQAVIRGAVSVDFIAGLKRVFLRTLFDRLSSDTTPSIVVIDESQPKPRPTVEVGGGGEFLVGGGVISANSAQVPGLQLADFAAFAITRYFRVRDAVAAGEGRVDDELIVKAIASLAGKVTCLLNEPPAILAKSDT